MEDDLLCMDGEGGLVSLAEAVPGGFLDQRVVAGGVQIQKRSVEGDRGISQPFHPPLPHIESLGEMV
ncbi:MAG: hypothetical protein ACLSEX_00030 [Blautia sp.]